MITLETLKGRLAEFPRTDLILSPTPIQKINRPPKVPSGVDLLIKRDDLTGLALGGNKGRKLEYIVADAAAKGADTLVTWGGIQSNWCLQTAAAAARAGLQARIVLLRKPGTPTDDADGNVLLDHLCGATVRVLDIDPGRGMLLLEDVADLGRADHERGRVGWGQTLPRSYRRISGRGLNERSPGGHGLRQSAG